MAPLAVLLLLTFQLRGVDLVEAAQTATAGLVTLIPEGLVLLMSVTFAVAAVRLARKDTLVQQMSATESLAAVDTICVDKTGTLTDGELRLLGIEVAEGVEPDEAQAALGRFAASAGDRNRTLETIAERFPGEAGTGRRRSPLLLGVEVERAAAAAAISYVLGAPGRPRRRRARWSCRRASPASSSRRRRRAGASSPSASRARRCPTTPRAGAAAAAHAARAGRAGGDAAPDAAETIAFIREEKSRPEADLRRRAGDGDRGRLRGRGAAATPA